jgi:hypothetical protein
MDDRRRSFMLGVESLETRFLPSVLSPTLTASPYFSQEIATTGAQSSDSADQIPVTSSISSLLGSQTVNSFDPDGVDDGPGSFTPFQAAKSTTGHQTPSQGGSQFLQTKGETSDDVKETGNVSTVPISSTTQNESDADLSNAQIHGSPLNPAKDNTSPPLIAVAHATGMDVSFAEPLLSQSLWSLWPSLQQLSVLDLTPHPASVPGHSSDPLDSDTLSLISVFDRLGESPSSLMKRFCDQVNPFDPPLLESIALKGSLPANFSGLDVVVRGFFDHLASIAPEATGSWSWRWSLWLTAAIMLAGGVGDAALVIRRQKRVSGAMLTNSHMKVENFDASEYGH